MNQVIPIIISKDENGKFKSGRYADIEQIDNKVCNTITCKEPNFNIHHCNMAIVISEGTMDNQDIIIGGMQENQSIKEDGICTTLTSSMGTGGGYVPMVVSKENQKIEENEFYNQAIKTAVENNAEEGDIVDAYNQKVIKTGISPTITTRPEGKKTAILPCVEKYRIRKLTPKECWRLMGFTDEDFEKAQSVNSNCQLYKQAGNSIVKQVLMAIFSQMIGDKKCS